MWISILADMAYLKTHVPLHGAFGSSHNNMAWHCPTTCLRLNSLSLNPDSWGRVWGRCAASYLPRISASPQSLHVSSCQPEWGLALSARFTAKRNLKTVTCFRHLSSSTTSHHSLHIGAHLEKTTSQCLPVHPVPLSILKNIHLMFLGARAMVAVWVG